MQQFATPFWEPSLPRGAGVLLPRMRGLRACWAGLGRGFALLCRERGGLETFGSPRRRSELN